MQTKSLGPVLDQLIEDYRGHLQTVAGLAPSTCVDRTYYVRHFLEEQFTHPDGKPNWERIKSQTVLTHILELSRRYPPATLQKVGSALRSFFRFLCLSQRCKVDLSSAVPRIAAGPTAQLIDFLSEKQLQQLFDSLDDATELSQRDHAVVLCIATFGLRAGEVAHLQLEDVDWRAGTIRLTRTKGRKERLLPLPQAVGEVLANYLQSGRAKSPSRSMFLSDRGPLPLSSNAVSKLCHKALRRAGLGGPRRRAHVLRHTVATHLVQAGANVKQVADLLGHRDLNTAQNYVKISLGQLSAVALPWPEVAR